MRQWMAGTSLVTDHSPTSCPSRIPGARTGDGHILYLQLHLWGSHHRTDPDLDPEVMSTYQRSFYKPGQPRAISVRFRVCPECLSPDLQVDRNGVVLCRQCLM